MTLAGGRAATLGVLLAATLGGCAAERGTIGAVIGQTPERHLVLREVPSSLAAGKAGLAEGDELLLIEGQDVRELDSNGVHRVLGGEVGAPVKLTLLRGRENRVIRVTLLRTAPPKKR